MRAAIVLLGLATALLLLPLSDLYLEATRDEGSFAEAAYRMWCGEMPHRDFHTHFPHLPSLEVWLAYRLLGVTVFAPRLVGMVQMFALALLVYAFARRYLGKFLAFAVALLILDFNALAWPVVSHHWQSTFFLLAMCLALFRRRWLAAGLAWGATLLTAQQSFFVAALFLLAYRQYRKELLLGMGLITLPYLLWLAANGALVGYFGDNFAVLGGVYESSRAAVSPGLILNTWNSQAPLMERWAELYSTAGLYLVFLLCASLTAVLAVIAPGEARWLALLATLHGIPLLAYHFKPIYFGFVDPILYIACLAGCRQSAAVRRFGLGLLIFAHSFWWAVLGCVPKYFRHPVQLPAGTLYCLDPRMAADLQRLEEAVRPHHRIWFSPVYVLSHLSPMLHKRNLSPYLNLRHYGPQILKEEAERVKSQQPGLLVLWKLAPEQQALAKLYLDIAPGYRPLLASEHWLVLEKLSSAREVRLQMGSVP